MVPPRPRQRKHKVQRRSSENGQDTNVAELDSQTKAQREERRRNLQAGLRAQQLSNAVSTKKKKRLDKYIDAKVKKEENQELIKRLSLNKIDTALLRSSKKLGRGVESKRESFEQAFRERKAGIAREWHEEALYQQTGTQSAKSTPPALREDESATAGSPVPEANQARNVTSVRCAAFGSGLKRPLELDEAGDPVIKKRARAPVNLQFSQDIEWSGFSSEEDSVSNDGSLRNGPAENDSDDLFNDRDVRNGILPASAEDTSDTSPSSSDEDDGRPDVGGAAKERISAFQAWATQQRNEATGFRPDQRRDLLSLPPKPTTSDSSKNSENVDEKRTIELPVVINSDIHAVQDAAESAKPFYVSVHRTLEIQEERLKLPVIAEEQRIMETIRANTCTIICGSTGSGKTTQVPQFLYEAGYGDPKGPTPGLIAVTQPRRVAAVSMAQRVAKELNDHDGKVSYQVRFDSISSSKTVVEFVTDGVLLRRISSDFTLSRYSVIVIDEAHERSLNTDLLIGMLMRIAGTRQDLSNKNDRYKPLKIVVMSATMSISELCSNASLFREGMPPVVNVEGRQYPVSMHFARKTQRDYIEAVISKVSSGHRKLPYGSFLVFLTGQSEIETVSKRLKDIFRSAISGSAPRTKLRLSANDAPIELDDVNVDLDDDQRYSSHEEDGSEIDIQGTDNEDNDLDIDEIQTTRNQKIHVVPLYSALPNEQQMRIYDPPPDGSRMIVLATNVAETSLTIPGVRFVFDCGRAKQKRYDPVTGVQTFTIDFISKASADQRAGRAGRTMAGHCYRLYSSAVYEQYFPQYSNPEITQTPVEGVVLQLKSIGIPNVLKFPFPTPPPLENLASAQRLLCSLGAIGLDDKITQHGRELSLYPLSPRLSQIIVLAEKEHCLQFALTLASMLTTTEVFVPENLFGISTSASHFGNEIGTQSMQEREQHRKGYNSFHGHLSRLDRHSDAIKLLVALADFLHESPSSQMHQFQFYTRLKAMQEAVKLRAQLIRIVSLHKPSSTGRQASAEVALPSSQQVKLLRKIIAAGYIDQIAIRADLSPTPPAHLPKSRRSGDVPYYTLFASSDLSKPDSDDPACVCVFIHSSSVLIHTAAANLPQYIVYSHLSRAAERSVHDPTGDVHVPKRAPKVRMHPLTPVSASQIVELTAGTPLLEESKSIGKVETLARNAAGEERRTCWVTPFLRGEQGSLGWPLPPARKVEQRRMIGKGWVTERVMQTRQ